jgi:hypothetical protein
MEVSRVAMNPWDFSLCESHEGSLVLKVIFSECEYKTDIGRYFVIDRSGIDATKLEDLKNLSARIRADYPDVSLPQIDKSDLTILK